jgi:hypothetical protein
MVCSLKGERDEVDVTVTGTRPESPFCGGLT